MSADVAPKAPASVRMRTWFGNNALKVYAVIAFAYLLLRRLLRLVTGSSVDLSKDVELMVLRHQLKVLRRHVDRPRLRRRERLFMAAMSRALPRGRWSCFLVRPQTLLRWHRALMPG